MYFDSQEFLDSIFMSYRKILDKFEKLNITTKNGKKITHTDLRKAVLVMLEKHPTCRWRSKKVRSKRYYIIREGYLWLIYVYFQKEKSLIDADVDFFEERIKEYEECLKISQDQRWWEEAMTVKQLLVVQALQEGIKYLPKLFNLIIFCIVLTIGTCLGWNPILIGIMTTTVITGSIKIPIKKDSNKN